MTEISQSDVRHLAQLSSLQLADDEIEGLRVDIERIVGYIEQLQELNTEGVEPTYQVTDLQNVWRDDIIDDYGVSREALIKLAPSSENHQIKVPKVL